MNSQQDPPATPEHGEPATAPQQQPVPQEQSSTSNGFFTWIRSLGISRGTDRWVGGVATGISARTGLDPILVRGIFVVLAIFGGIGLLLYGVAWALLPEPDGRIHVESAGRGSWTSGMTGALIVTILGLWRPNLPFFGDSGGLGGLLWSLFWIGAVILAVYWIVNASRNRKQNDDGTPPPLYPETHATAGTPPVYGPVRNPSTVPTQRTYPATRPIPAPVKPAKPATPRPTGSDLAVFLGGAILAVGTVLALDYTNILQLDGEVFTAALAAGLLVLGIGIVVLGIRGRSSGFLGFAAAVGIVLALVSGAAVGTGNWVFANQGHWAGETTRAAEQGYTVVAGQGTIDLRGLDNLSEDVTVPVITAAGDVGILVPDDVPVDIRTQLAASATDLVSPGDTASTGGLWQPGGLSLNEDAAGPSIILEIRGLASHVTIATSENGLTEQGIRLEP